MKKTVGLLLALLMMFGGFCVCSAAGAAESEIVIQLGHHDVTTPDNHNHYFATKFAEYSAQTTGGRVKIEVLGNAQLGAERDLMEGMQLGSVELAIITNLAIGPFVPQYMVYDLPFIFKDTETAFKVLDSDVTKEVDQIMLDQLGIRVLARGQGGFRHIVNSVRPIKEVADMEGLKIRVPETQLYMQTFRNLNSNPTPMAWTETFTGMQQKTVDAAEIPTSVIYTTRFYDVAGYISLTGHFFSPVCLLASDSMWQTIPADVQKQLLEAANKAAMEQRQFISDNEEKLLTEMEGLGMQIDRDVNKAAFQEAVRPVYDIFRDQIGADLMQRIIDLANN